jgi:crotonobetaine/carnitine-CoA ligase
MTPFLRYLIEAQAEKRAAQNFLAFNDNHYSYGEINAKSNQVAQILLELGLKPNDRVAIFLPNSPDFIYIWFATIKLNVTLVPLNTQLKGEALRYIAGHAAPHLVITNPNLLKELNKVAEVLPEGCKVLVLGKAEESPLPFFSYAQMLAQATAERPPDVAIREEDTALIIYTSGTTGHPKGVMIGRRAQTNHPLYYHPELIKTEPHQTAYTYLPLFHITSLGVTMGSFIGGAQLALDTEFHVMGFWERIRKHKAVVFPYLGAVLSMLYKRPPREDDSNHTARWALGAAAPKEIWEAFEKRFGVKLLETYGQTEWMSIWCKHPEGETRIGAAGKIPARAEVKIIDQSGQVVPPGTPGQIIMRPKENGLMMSGYYLQPELNAKVFKDGWYYTGDVGEFDEEGYLYFKGRLKDYIRRRGENISAFEIERVVSLHPLILEAAAIGVPSELGEEEVLLCVVLKPDSELSAGELWKYCRANLPAFMTPRFIRIMPELPHTPTQRVRKFLLAEQGTKDAWDRKIHRKGLEPA